VKVSSLVAQILQTRSRPAICSLLNHEGRAVSTVTVDESVLEMEPWKSNPHLAERCTSCKHLRSSHYVVKGLKKNGGQEQRASLFGSGCFSCACEMFGGESVGAVQARLKRRGPQRRIRRAELPPATEPEQQLETEEEHGDHMCLRGKLCCRCSGASLLGDACAD